MAKTSKKTHVDFHKSNQFAAWIILSDPARYVGIVAEWALLWKQRYGEPKAPPDDYREEGIEDRLQEQHERREKRKIQGKLRRWLDRPWKVSRKGNPFRRFKQFQAIIFRQGEKWSAVVVHRETQEKRFAPRPVETEEQAKIAAFHLALYMEGRRSMAHPAFSEEISSWSNE